MKRSLSTYVRLFFVMLKLSAFTFGGGYVIISLMKKEFVDRYGWISEKEMIDYTAIAQSSPGAIAVNASILVGIKIGGAAGMIISILGTIIPPLVILTALSYIYAQFIEIAAVRYIMLGMQAGVAAVICDVVVSLACSVWRENKWIAAVTAVISFILVALLSVNVMIIVAFCLLFGILLYGRGGGKKNAS